MRTETCEIHTLATLVAALRLWDVNVAGVLAAAGLESAQLDHPTQRITLDQFETVWRAARRFTGDEAIGLRVLETFDPEVALVDLVFHLASASATPREAFERASSFIGLSHEAIELDLSVVEGETICRVEYRGIRDRSLSEYLVGLVLHVADVIVGSQKPYAAWFTHSSPSYADEYARLGVDVRFDAPFQAIVGTADNLDEALPTADRILCALLERQAREAWTQVPRDSDFSELVHAKIQQNLASGTFSSEEIAASLGISSRTLRKRLSESGRSFQQILDAVRFQRARRELAEPGATVTEVAHSLGFADASAFRKAFMRWTGKERGAVTATTRPKSPSRPRRAKV